MLMKLLRKLLLVWIMAWLPLSGAIAAIMPITGMPGGAAATEFAAMPVEDDVAEPIDGAAIAIIASLPCHSAAPASGNDSSGSCNHCVLCHLAGALMMPSIPGVPGLMPSNNFVAAPLSSHASFFPDLPSPPPRTFVS